MVLLPAARWQSERSHQPGLFHLSQLPVNLLERCLPKYPSDLSKRRANSAPVHGRSRSEVSIACGSDI